MYRFLKTTRVALIPVRYGNFSTALMKECWKCGHSNKKFDLVCAKVDCGAIQKINLDDVNFFQLLKVPQDSNPSGELLDKQFKQLQMDLHPDKHTNKTADEQEISAHSSAVVNIGYQTLKDPVLRAYHLMAIMYPTFDVYTEIDSLPPDEQLMTDVFEIREDVEEAKNYEELLAIKKHVEAMLNDAIYEFDMKYKQRLDSTELLKAVAKMNYLAKALEEIELRD